jgi:hypothetical protein
VPTWNLPRECRWQVQLGIKNTYVVGSSRMKREKIQNTTAFPVKREGYTISGEIVQSRNRSGVSCRSHQDCSFRQHLVQLAIFRYIDEVGMELGSSTCRKKNGGHIMIPFAWKWALCDHGQGVPPLEDLIPLVLTFTGSLQRQNYTGIWKLNFCWENCS